MGSVREQTKSKWREGTAAVLAVNMGWLLLVPCQLPSLDNWIVGQPATCTMTKGCLLSLSA